MSETKAITVVLDESGSMFSLWDEAIGSFNSWLAEAQQALAGQTIYLTVMKFDTVYRPLAVLEPLDRFEPLTKATYTPRGNTALYDAIAATMEDSEIKAKREKLPIGDWLCVILTDGQENSSRHWTKEMIEGEIARRQADSWEFLYLSSSPTAWADASKIGVLPGATYSHMHTAGGITTASATLGGYTGSWAASSGAENKQRRLQGVGALGDTDATVLPDAAPPNPYKPESKGSK